MVLIQPCPLCCTHKAHTPVKGPDKRRYYLCNHCHLIFTDPSFFLPVDAEKNVYLQHENCIENQGYVNFLQKIIRPTLQWLRPGMKGLDYGCGPGPTLSILLQNEGMMCDNWDPIFFPELDQSKTYDFIFATECFEHFFHPARELSLMLGLLKQGGILAIMTQLRTQTESFTSWHYPLDPTHVSFYHPDTFAWISETYPLELVYSDKKSVVILKRKA